MMKSFLLILLTLVLSTSLMAKSNGSFKLLTHEQYVHLTDKQKNEYHIMIMELMVELESQYKTDTRTFGFSKSRFEKFQKAVSQLQNIFLVPSAYAAPVTPAALTAQWNGMAQDFANLSTREKVGGGNCVFAGWISRVRDNVCVHPMAAEFNPVPGDPSRQAPEFKSYPRDPSKGCNESQMQGKYIQCNPLIFGYKKKSEGSLFCVSTDNLAENSSYRCMTAALESTRVASNNHDSAEQRLADLRSRYSQPENAAAFESVFMFNFKTCICPTAPNASYSTRYQNHIRPDINDPNAAGKFQACYGMMKMMDKTLIDCAPPSNLTISPDARSIFESFRQFTAADPGLQSGSAASSRYVSFIKDNLQSGSANAAYSSLCAVTPRQEEPQDEPVASTCSVACVDKAGAEADSNTRKSNAVLSCSVSEIKVPNAQRQLTAVANPVLVTMQIPEAKPAAGEAPAIAITFTGQGITTAQSASCSATYPTAQTPQSDITCAAQCTHTPAKAEEGSSPAVAEKFECIPTVSTSTNSILGTVKTTPLSSKPASIEVEYESPATPGIKATIACEATWTTASGGGNEVITPGGPSLEVTPTPVGETQYKVVATSSNATGFSLSLKAKAPGTGGAQEKNITDTDKSSEHTFDRKSEKFQVCGQLKKTGDDKPEKCVEIPALGAPTTTDGKPAGNPVNVPKIAPPQAPFMRNGADTSARGIK